MTVNELIDNLTKLPEEFKGLKIYIKNVKYIHDFTINYEKILSDRPFNFEPEIIILESID